MVEQGDGFACPCGATATLYEGRISATARVGKPKQSASKPSNNTLILNLKPELKERLEASAKKRELSAEEYVIHILDKEAGRIHHKPKERKCQQN